MELLASGQRIESRDMVILTDERNGAGGAPLHIPISAATLTGIFGILVALTAPQISAQQPQSLESTPGPAAVFDSLWTAFDQTYALFEDKRVHWDDVRRAYRPRALRAATEEEFFDVVTEMLALLNDNHVKLTGWSGIMSAGGDLRGAARIEDFSRDLIREEYLLGPPQERVGGLISFGWLADSVGYVHVAAMDDPTASGEALDAALATFRSARGIVLDLRRNFGGDDSVGREIARRFADRHRRYMTTRLKRGSGRDDFTAPRHWNLTPPPGGGFTRPVVVLTHGFTFSAGENLVLALRVLPHVTVLGTETSGSMGETTNDVLPNGWVYRTVFQRILDAEGRSWEGSGIPPDLRVANTSEEIRQGRDRALEAAIRLTSVDRSGTIPVDTSLDRASLSGRLPLADSLAAWIEGLGPSAAMRRFEEARSDTTRWFLAEDWAYGDLVTLGEGLLEDGRPEVAVVVLEAAVQAYPASYRPHAGLAKAYRFQGRPEDANAARRRALELNSELYSADRRAAIELRNRIPLSHVFLDRLFDEGADSAIHEYRRLKNDARQRLEVDPLLLVRGGQQLREAGQLEEARAVFAFVLEEFPDWPIGYLGFAEVSAAMNDFDAAIRSYQNVLQLDPGNRAAREGIARLRERSGVNPDGGCERSRSGGCAA